MFDVRLLVDYQMEVAVAGKKSKNKIVSVLTFIAILVGNLQKQTQGWSKMKSDRTEFKKKHHILEIVYMVYKQKHDKLHQNIPGDFDCTKWQSAVPSIAYTVKSKAIEIERLPIQR